MTNRERIYNELLVLRCRRGDRAALQELVSLWERRLFYFIRRIVTSEEDAWDALQDTWLKVTRDICRLREPAALATWLYRIARNTAISRLRQQERTELLDETTRGAECGEDPDFAAFESAEALHRGLNLISRAHREALTLHFLEGMKIAEIAEVIGSPPGTIKARLHHAKRALREVLEKEYAANAI